MANTRHHHPAPVVTLTPRSTTPTETWTYTLPGGRRGVTIGDVTWAATSILFLGQKKRWRRVSLRFLKARWGGLRSQTVTATHPSELQQLREVDAGQLRARHAQADRWKGKRLRVRRDWSSQ